MNAPYPMGSFNASVAAVSAAPTAPLGLRPEPQERLGHSASVTDAEPSLIKLVNAHRDWERQWAYHAPFAAVSRLDARDADNAAAAGAHVWAEITRRFPEYAAKRMGAK